MFGAEKILQQTVKIIGKKHEVYIHFGKDGDTEIKAKKIFKFDIWPIPSFRSFVNPYNFFLWENKINRYWKNISETIERINPSIIYINTIQPQLLTKKIKKRYPSIKIIWHDHNIQKNIFRKLYINKLSGYADLILCVSNEVRKNYKDLKKAVVLYNGIYTLMDKKLPLKLESNLYNIAFVGRITKKKGLLKLIKAFKFLDNRFILNIYGSTFRKDDHKYLKKIKKYIKENNLKNIMFHGFSNNVEEIYKRSNLVVVPSTYPDPLPNVISESIFNGTPVLGSSFGGIKEMLDKKFIFNSLNSKHIAEKIKVFKDYKYTDDFIEFQARYVELFSREVYITNLEKIFGGILY